MTDKTTHLNRKYMTNIHYRTYRTVKRNSLSAYTDANMNWMVTKNEMHSKTLLEICINSLQIIQNIQQWSNYVTCDILIRCYIDSPPLMQLS